MFWGLVLEPGKRYSTTVDKAFHVSMACLDCASVNSDHEVLYVLLENDGQEYRICNLSKKGCFQVNLDLSFMTGDSIAFELKGSGIVHLSGYILPEDDDDDFPGDEDDEDLDEAEDEEEESVNQKMLKGSKKALANALQNAKKMQKMEESDDDDDEDDDDDDDDDLSEADDDDDDDDDDEEEEDDDDDDDDDDEEEEDLKQKILALKKGGPQANKKGQSPAGKVQTTPGQQKGGKPQTPSGKPQTPGGKPQTPGGKPQTPAGKPQTPAGKPQTPAGKMLNGTSPDNQQQSGKKRKRRSKGGAAAGGEPQSPAAQAPPQQPNSQQKPNKAKKQRMSNGLTIKDLKVGNGPVAKPGQTVAVWYEGRLQSTGRTFDACRRNGAPFRFRLGRSEVIRAWDEGVAGMQVGGQRRITCPPHLAYGSRGAPPAIPPNSTLVFQVELKSVQ